MRTRSLPQKSNRATFSEFIQFRDDDGELMAIGDLDEVTVRIRDPHSNTTLLEATLTGGSVEETGDGEVQFTFSESQMQTLAPQNYEFGVTVTTENTIVQTHLCQLPIVEGL